MATAKQVEKRVKELGGSIHYGAGRLYEIEIIAPDGMVCGQGAHSMVFRGTEKSEVHDDALKAIEEGFEVCTSEGCDVCSSPEEVA